MGSVFMLMHFKTFICRHYLCVTTIFNEMVCWKCLGNEEIVTVHFRWFVHPGASNMSLLYCHPSVVYLKYVHTAKYILRFVYYLYVCDLGWNFSRPTFITNKCLIGGFIFCCFLSECIRHFVKEKTKINKHTK